MMKASKSERARRSVNGCVNGLSVGLESTRILKLFKEYKNGC